MTLIRTFLLLFGLLLQGCSAQGAGMGTPPPAGGGGASGSGGNQVAFSVDGQAFAFRTPQVRHGRARAGEDLVAESFELASADQSLYARLVLYVAPGREDLSGVYPVVSVDRDGARAGVAELLLAEETELARGRRMFPGGGGRVEVEHRGAYFVVRFEFTGDGLFRSGEAPPVTGEMSFHAPS